MKSCSDLSRPLDIDVAPEITFGLEKTRTLDGVGVPRHVHVVLEV